MFGRRIAGLAAAIPEGPDIFGSGVADELGGLSDRLNTGISSVMQGPIPPAPPSIWEMTKTATKDSISSGIASGLGAQAARKFGISAGQRGKDNSAYLANSFPDLNPWERSGSSATGMGSAVAQDASSGVASGRQTTTAERVAGINAVTSRANTKDQVHAQNALVQFRQQEIAAQTLKLLADKDVSKQQVFNLIADAKLKDAQTIRTWAETGKIPVEVRHLLSMSSLNDARAEGQRNINPFLADDLNQRIDESESREKLNNVNRMGVSAATQRSRDASSRQDAMFNMLKDALDQNPSMSTEEKMDLIGNFIEAMNETGKHGSRGRY